MKTDLKLEVLLHQLQMDAIELHIKDNLVTGREQRFKTKYAIKQVILNDVIGADEPTTYESTLGAMGSPNYAGITRNQLKAIQRRTLKSEQ